MSAGRGVVIDPLGEDIAGSGKNLSHGIDTRFLGIDLDGVPNERGSLSLRIGGRILGQQEIGKRFESEFPGNRRTGSLLRFEGEIDILQGIEGICRLDLGAKFLGEELAFFQGSEDGFTAFIERFQLLETVSDFGDLDLIQLAGAFFSVTGDERNGRSFLQKDGSGGDLTGLKAEFSGDLSKVFFDHG